MDDETLARMNPDGWMTEDGDWLVDPESAQFIADAQAMHAEVERLRAEAAHAQGKFAQQVTVANGYWEDAQALRAQREAVLAICTGPTTGENKIGDRFLAIRGIYGVSE